MDLVQAIFSSLITIFFFGMMVATVWKLFQISGELGEIKTMVTDLRRNAGSPAAKPVQSVAPVPPPQLAGPISLESAEALLREVAAESEALAASESPRTTA